MAPAKLVWDNVIDGERVTHYYWKWSDGTLTFNRPDYFNDLNACHEMEKVLAKGEAKKIIHATNAYTEHLGRILECADTALFQFAHATAEQRAEAFGKTLNLW